MVDEFDLYNALVSQGYYKRVGLKNLTEARLKIYNNLLKERERTGVLHIITSKRFHALSSYNFRMNPSYKYMFIPEDVEPQNRNIVLSLNNIPYNERGY